MTKQIAYITNNYSSTGMVQIQRFGLDDGVSDPTKCKWAYVCQDTNSPGVAGIGRTHALKPGSRVHVSQYGGPDGSFIVEGSFGRMGPGNGQSGGSSEDNATTFNNIDTTRSDFAVPVENASAKNGERAKAKAPDGRYNEKAGGKPFDFDQNTYPNTAYRDA